MKPKSLYHAHLEVKTRSKGQSAAAAAAYICALSIVDSWTGKKHDFTGKGGVLKHGVFNFQGSVAELPELMDSSEKRVNSCVCRSLDVALPSGLTIEQRWELVEAIATIVYLRWGVPVIGALHLPSRHGSKLNDHAHFVFATRQIENGCLTVKTRRLDNRKTGVTEIVFLRTEISRIIVAMLVSLRRGREASLWDSRSYAERGIANAPGKHRGPRRTRQRRLHQKEAFRKIDAEVEDMIARGEKAAQVEKAISAIEAEFTMPARKTKIGRRDTRRDREVVMGRTGLSPDGF